MQTLSLSLSLSLPLYLLTYNLNMLEDVISIIKSYLTAVRQNIISDCHSFCSPRNAKACVHHNIEWLFWRRIFISDSLLYHKLKAILLFFCISSNCQRFVWFFWGYYIVFFWSDNWKVGIPRVQNTSTSHSVNCRFSNSLISTSRLIRT